MNDIAVQSMVLACGDDYELCFTAPTSMRPHIHALGRKLGLTMGMIGQTRSEAGVDVYDANGARVDMKKAGFDHFA